MEQDYRLAEGEYRFACLVWANEPLGSGQLVALAHEALGWKKSTTYTVLKKLCERGILHNANGTVTALVKQAQVQQEESAAVVQKLWRQLAPLCGRFFEHQLHQRGRSCRHPRHAG